MDFGRLIAQLQAAFQRHRATIVPLAMGSGAAAVVIVIVVAVVLAMDGDDGGERRLVSATLTPRATARLTPTSATRTRPTLRPIRTATATDQTPEATEAPGEEPTDIVPDTPTMPPIDQTPGKPTFTPTGSPPTTPTQVPISVSIIAPQPGATVPPTFTVEIAVTGIELALGPNGEPVPGAAHWHAAIDTQPPLPVPYGTGSAQVGPLTAGPHTVTALLNLNDSDATVVAFDQIEIMVAK